MRDWLAWQWYREGWLGVFVFLLIAAMFTALGYGLWVEYRYPCVRSEQYACLQTQYAGSVHDAPIYITVPSTCTRCLERTVRP